jgi:hypothetical protein
VIDRQTIASTLLNCMVIGCVAITAIGCSKGAGSVSVEGTVTLDGAPLAAAYLTLAPLDATIKGPFTGKTDEQGHFALGPVGDSGGGVPPGPYQLAMTTASSENAGMEDAVIPPERVPPDARVRDLEIPEDGLPDLKLELSSK